MQEESALFPWPPAYSIKRHKRAKHVKLRACRHKGLIITLPMRFSMKHIASILEENRAWICKHLKSPLETNHHCPLPQEICLHSFNASHAIIYVATSNKLTLIERPTGEVVLFGKTSDEQVCKRLLKNWLKEKAKLILMRELIAVSEIMNLSFSSLTVRDQQTVWGSCTSKKGINLNYRLILLPFTLLRYVMIHELAHTVHLNHSAAFWGLVEKYDENWREHRRALRDTARFIPDWLL